MQNIDKRDGIAARIIDFARDNNLMLHPGQEPLKWADLLIKHNGGCPCVPSRKDGCPCKFVLEDLKSHGGRCACGLFVNDAYLKEYYALLDQAKSHRRRRKNP